MKVLVDRLALLAERHPKIKLYRGQGAMVVLKNMGKVTGGLDRQYQAFLTETNGASVLDYCFLGFKNPELGLNLYDNIMEMWALDSLLAMKFWAFAGTSTGESFGYLARKNAHGSHFIGLYRESQPETVTVIASSFEYFLAAFIDKVETLLATGADTYWLPDDAWAVPNPADTELASYLDANGASHYPLDQD